MSSDSPLQPPLSLPADALQINSIRIELPSISNKSIKAAELFVDGDIIPAKWDKEGSGNLCFNARLKLDPPRPLSPGSHIALHVHLTQSKFMGTKRITEPIQVSVDELVAAVRKHELAWKRSFHDLTIHIKGSQPALIAPPLDSRASVRSVPDSLHRQDTLQGSPPSIMKPTTEEILEHCPRFRILVMGKTGAGKSLLINKTFGVDDAIVAEDEPGYADINHEIFSEDNPHFVLHDSMGFEQGDVENVDIVRKFILGRSNREQIGDNLHAIWLCIAIPVTGGRLLEKGVEEFLDRKLRGELGKVPIIVVFTKYDQLLTNIRRNMGANVFEGMAKADIDILVDDHAQGQLHMRWINSFEERTQNKISHIYVSSKDNHERNLANLVQMTYDCVNDYFADASIVSAMAQRVSPVLNIKASIAVGRRKYWARLARSLAFHGRPLLQCVDVIHADIIGVWRLNDPNNFLSSREFKGLISKLVDKEENPVIVRTAHRVIPAGVSMVAGLAGILSGVAAATVAAPIVVPIAAALVFAKWVNDVYQHTSFVLERLMTYIIDLSLVLQNLFWLQTLRSPGKPVTRRLIKIAVQAYAESNAKQALLFKIEQHVRDGLRLDMGPDTTLSRIEELLHAHIIDSAEVLSYRSSLNGSSVNEWDADEDWDSRNSTNDWQRLRRGEESGVNTHAIFEAASMAR